MKGRHPHTKKERLVILGGGISGMAVAMLGAQKGCDVFLCECALLVTDLAKALQEQSITYASGTHSMERLCTPNLAATSP